jgi:hypothetical protein
MGMAEKSRGIRGMKEAVSCSRQDFTICRSLVRVAIVILLAAAIFPVSGCGGKSRRTSELAAAINPVLLNRDLRLLLDGQLAEVLSTATDVAARVPDRRVRENCLRLKVRIYGTYTTIVTEEDPRLAFIAAWVGTVGFRQYLTSDEGKNAFGAGQATVLKLTEKVEAEIVALGEKHFPAGTIAAAKQDIELAACGNAAKDPFAPIRGVRAEESQQYLMGILRLPLLPVKTLEGASSTPEAVKHFTDTARDIANIVRHMPEEARWNIELLLFEMETSGPMAVVSSDVDRLDKTIRESVAAVQTMPADIRGQFEEALGAVGRTQPEISTMLTEAYLTAETVRSAVEGARSAVAEARNTVAAAGSSAEQVTTTAGAVRTAVEEVRGLLGDYGRMSQKSDKEPKKEETTGIKDYTAMAESFTVAAREVRGLLGDIQQPPTQQSGLKQATEEMKGIANAVFLRALALVGIIFVLAVLYAYVVRRLGKQRAGAVSEPPRA